MKPSITVAEFEVMVAQTGLPLSTEQRATLYDAYWMLEGMIERVNQPMPLDQEPAHIFIPETQ
jgi:hypothetical protein